MWPEGLSKMLPNVYKKLPKNTYLHLKNDTLSKITHICGQFGLKHSWFKSRMFESRFPLPRKPLKKLWNDLYSHLQFYLNKFKKFWDAIALKLCCICCLSFQNQFFEFPKMVFGSQFRFWSKSWCCGQRYRIAFFNWLIYNVVSLSQSRFFNDFHNAWVNKFLIISPMLTWIMWCSFDFIKCISEGQISPFWS